MADTSMKTKKNTEVRRNQNSNQNNNQNQDNDVSRDPRESQGDRKPPRKKPNRKPLKYAICRVDMTAPQQDSYGNDIPGTERPALVVLPFPPNLPEDQQRSRAAIKKACKSAVYDLGLEEYGNVNLRICAWDEDFVFPCEKITITKLLSPEEVSKLENNNRQESD